MRSVPHRLGHLNTLSPGDGTVWGGLAGAVLLGEVGRQGEALRAQRLDLHLVHSLCFVLVIEM